MAYAPPGGYAVGGVQIGQPVTQPIAAVPAGGVQPLNPMAQPYVYFPHFFPPYMPGLVETARLYLQIVRSISSANLAIMQNGTQQYYGRTQAEVQYNDNVRRAQTLAAAQNATSRFSPNASPSDLFFVFDHQGNRSLQSFATIETYADGRWLMNAADNTSYYDRRYPLP
jgi:hypothetical protein